MGPLRSPTSVCVCVMCGSRELCTSFVSLCQVTRSRPATQHTAHSPRSLERQYQLAVQTAIKRHILERTQVSRLYLSKNLIL